MRFHEFNILKEYSADTTDAELRKEVVGLVQKADRGGLDRVYQTLSAGDFDLRIQAALSANDDAISVKDKLIAIINSTRGTYQEKNDFINGFDRGYIDIQALLAPSGGLETYFTGNNFAKQVFMTASKTIVSMGVGPGEVALAAFSPLIKFAGTSRGAGDLIIMDKVSVEVKGKIASWGRLQDPRKAKYNTGAVRDAFEKAGLNPGRAMSLSGWATARQQLDPKVTAQLSQIIVDSMFRFTDPNDNKIFAQTLASGDLAAMREGWGIMSYDNYQTVSGFDGILFFDANTGATRYINDAIEIATLKVEMPNVFGPEQEAMPKIGF
jgi:hypothetical protein